jgi:hypothetical protein
VIAATLLLGSRAEADDVDPAARSAARALGYAGVDAFEKHEYETASDKLEKAFAILKVPSIGLWSARALLRLGRMVQASERYRLVGTLPTSGGELAVQQQAQADAARELRQLLPRIPSVVVLVDGGGASQVTIDEAAVPVMLMGEHIPINPGAHRLIARRGDEVAAADLSLGEAEHKQVLLRFPPAPRPRAEPAPSSGGAQKTLGITSLALGGAALAAGAITGVVAVNKKSSFDSNPACKSDMCPSSLQGEVDSYNQMRLISSISLLAGGILVGTGGILLLTLPKSEERVSLRVTPASVTLIGSF